MRKATELLANYTAHKPISIHTFLAEGDRGFICSSYRGYNFNPHLPCGRRPRLPHFQLLQLNFNPHLPCGRRLEEAGKALSDFVFQSTPSLRKATRFAHDRKEVREFQSTPSLRKATLKAGSALSLFGFQSTPSLRKATRRVWQINS